MTQNKQLKKHESKYLVTGSLIIASIIIISYSSYLYNYFPDEKVFETIFGTFESNYYESVRYFVWALLSKLVPIFLLLIWFTTCKHWWYHVIAVPIAIYIFQLFGVINDDIDFVDEVEFVYSLPITIIVLIILYFIRSKINVFLKAQDLKKQVDEQMEKAINKRHEDQIH
ncbi:hypothetical protein [Urechidicola croceus]|nr:hypothetical protein [Urechidicola croceus]